ncbi:MAG TPA: tRNA lysidine(34) synthetase TilS [Anaerohalosphaeraceae bacterium]|nr:tRNA lysidine(34) synthetase TilS [Anaerohalosphaeraceae bacterium]HQG05355.1 tRNA lysidine(34) synthetase TilS [Anaerohalosphaeraceae bacterium]HQI06728.1 tRNA lysidine(34) synthetase TilS [Anaerohalosphaeraceae bacterium]HQJ67149.1 tRNA lysidine(34) synthetase TilS [Anaerohalosphaeraceae bacterium]
MNPTVGSDSFEEQVRAGAERCRLPAEGGRLLLAVSGGADSMAMLEALQCLQKGGVLRMELAVGHVNHQLRGAASDGDERFVEDEAGRRGLAFFSRAADAAGYAQRHRLSVETAARILRLRLLAETARCWQADAVATAHQQDDQMETLIFRLLRGTSFRGLCGIRPSVRLEGVRFVRPMLSVSRERILDYCREKHLGWREDATNADCGFARNRIRHRMLPFLHRQGGRQMEAEMLRLAERCQSLFETVEQQAQEQFVLAALFETGEQVVLNRSVLEDCSPFVLGEIIRQCLLHLKVGLRDYTARHYQTVIEGIYQGRQRCVVLPGEIECLVNEKTLTFCRRKESAEPSEPEPMVLPIGQTGQFGPWRIRSAVVEKAADGWKRPSAGAKQWTEYLDADKVRGPVRVRMRRAADRFVPLGMSRPKKVGKFLTAVQADEALKKGVFVVEDAEKILWVAPLRISEEVKIDEQTGRILQLSIWQQVM